MEELSVIISTFDYYYYYYYYLLLLILLPLQMLDDWFVNSWKKSDNMEAFPTLPHELTSGSEFATDFSLFLTPTSSFFKSSPSFRLTRKVLSHISSLPAIRASCPSHRNLLNLMAQTLLREQWKIRSFSLCNSHYSLLWHWCYPSLCRNGRDGKQFDYICACGLFIQFY
jgi:hypothetical protein